MNLPSPQLVLFLFYRTCAQSIQRTSDRTKLDVSKRCKDLASFMESLLQEMKTPGVNKDGPIAADELKSFSVTIISYVLVSPSYTLLTLIITYATMRSALVRYVKLSLCI